MFLIGLRVGSWIGGLILSLVLGLPLAAAVFMVLIAIDMQTDKQEKQDEERRKAEREKQEQRDLVQAKKKQAVDKLIENSRVAVRHFELMPTYLSDARQHAEMAKFYRADGAFSPFWASIEGAYISLNNYRQAADTVAFCSEKHFECVEEVIRSRVDPNQIFDFPVTLHPQSVQAPAEALVNELDIEVYEAQKHEVFAQIWEQRRTTTAVIDGFNNLEDAVNRMGSSMSRSISSLSHTLESTQNNLRDRIDRSIRFSANTASSIGEEQLKVMRELRQHSDRTNQELMKLNHKLQ